MKHETNTKTQPNPMLASPKIGFGSEVAYVSINEKTGERTPFRLTTVVKLTPILTFVKDTRRVRVAGGKTKEINRRFRTDGTEYKPEHDFGVMLSAIPEEIELARTYDDRREADEEEKRKEAARFSARPPVKALRAIRSMTFNREEVDAIEIIARELSIEEFNTFCVIGEKLAKFCNR